jgi:hypothetical protein
MSKIIKARIRRDVLLICTDVICCSLTQNATVRPGSLQEPLPLACIVVIVQPSFRLS